MMQCVFPDLCSWKTGLRRQIGTAQNGHQVNVVGYENPLALQRATASAQTVKRRVRVRLRAVRLIEPYASWILLRHDSRNVGWRQVRHDDIRLRDSAGAMVL